MVSKRGRNLNPKSVVGCVLGVSFLISIFFVFFCSFFFLSQFSACSMQDYACNKYTIEVLYSYFVFLLLFMLRYAVLTNDTTTYSPKPSGIPELLSCQSNFLIPITKTYIGSRKRG